MAKDSREKSQLRARSRAVARRIWLLSGKMIYAKPEDIPSVERELLSLRAEMDQLHAASRSYGRGKLYLVVALLIAAFIWMCWG